MRYLRRYKKQLQGSLLFDPDLGFSKRDFRKKCNPEVDEDTLEFVIKDAITRVLEDLNFEEVDQTSIQRKLLDYSQSITKSKEKRK